MIVHTEQAFLASQLINGLTPLYVLHFSEILIYHCNNLSESTDFSSLSNFKLSLDATDVNLLFNVSHLCFFCEFR